MLKYKGGRLNPANDDQKTEKKQKFRWLLLLLHAILFSVIPILSFYLMEFMDRNPFEQIRPQAHLFNIILYELIAWILYLLIGRARWALRMVLFCSAFIGLVNHYVMEFRSTPFVPWDIFSIRTAASVASGYDFTVPGRIWLILGGYLLLMILVHFMNFRMPSIRNVKTLLARLGAAALCLAVLVIFAGRLQDEDFQTAHRLYPYQFTPGVMVKYDGYAVTFTMDLEYLFVDKPSGYNAKQAKKELESYADSAEAADASEADYPNIIVIMDEAFSDLKILGDFDTNTDYMPFVHSLEDGAENTITGYLNVSVCGGNTANTEFEFLTGNTMAFLPAGSIPYQQYIRGNVPSMASYLESLGYATYAQHPYNASGWNREKVYPWMGFESMAFSTDYINPIRVRKYISDQSDFEKIIETYEEKEDGKPAFIFNVTMQNHGGYTDTYDNFTNTVTADGLGNSALNQYLTLIQMTDSALEELVSYFSQVEEKTIIVFFGDHQPNDTVAASVLAANGMNYKNLSQEQQELRYQVPYVIWANYDIEEAEGQDTSANYLGAEVLQTAGIPLSDYDNFLMELKEAYPVISAVRTEESSDTTDDSLLDEYRELQYYRMFDYEQ